MNILITINKNYLKQAFIMLRSLKDNNKDKKIKVYIVSNDVKDEDVKDFFIMNDFEYSIIPFKDEMFDNAPTNKRYPSVIYYRLLASEYLPKDIDRILYLDPDIIILKSLDNLYNMDFNDNYYVGATNVKELLRKFNEIKNNAPKSSPYINTGVLLMNLNKLREINVKDLIINYLLENKAKLTLSDQDILQGLFGDKIILIDNLIFNLSDREITKYNLVNKNKIDNNWVEENACIIHYIGKNKPWSDNYKGILKKYYIKYKSDKLLNYN